jgi:hypothetical protein
LLKALFRPRTWMNTPPLSVGGAIGYVFLGVSDGKRDRTGISGLLRVSLAFLTLAAATSRSESTSPKAVVPEASRDLGIVAPGETAAAAFAIRNQGKGPLHLEWIRPEPPHRDVRVSVEGAPVPAGATATVRAARASSCRLS